MSLNQNSKKLEPISNFCEIISFLDDNSWDYSNKVENFPFLKSLDEKIHPHINILWHWLIYINDRAKKADDVWRSGSKKVKDLLTIYFRNEVQNDNDLKKIYDYETGKIYDDKETNVLKYIPEDNKSVFDTLKTLLKYDKNIIYYLKINYDNWDELDKDKNFEEPKNEAVKIAYLLYKLSFSEQEIIQENGYIWHKRIWAALRDYVRFNKLNRIFTHGLNKLVIKKVNYWNDYFHINLCDLELPGDKWNDKFAQNFFLKFSNEAKDIIINGDWCLKNIIKKWSKKKIETRDILSKDFPKKPYLYSKLIRIFYEKLIKPFENQKEFLNSFCPTKLDFSFNFASKLCKQNNIELCNNICIFGRSGGKCLCVPGSVICPIGFISCDYIIPCVNDYEKFCPIYQLKGKNLCKIEKK